MEHAKEGSLRRKKEKEEESNRCLVCLRGALRQGNMGTSAEHEYNDVSNKRLLTGNFLAKIFELKFNTFMNITTTILEVRFLWGFLRSSCITVK